MPFERRYISSPKAWLTFLRFCENVWLTFPRIPPKVQLGEAAKRDVGTGANQIPDMSKWTSLKADYGWRLTPDGFLEQWGRGNYGNGDGDFVIPFPNRCVFVLISSDPNDTPYAEITEAFPVSNSKFRIGCATAEGNSVNPANLTCNWYAKGW